MIFDFLSWLEFSTWGFLPCDAWMKLGFLQTPKPNE